MRAAILIALFVLGACSKGHEPKVHQVAIRAMQFVPATLEVAVGDSVVFTNEDLVPHTATDTGVFDSQQLQSKQTWTYKASTAGVYPYGCTFHPTMKGTLTVRE